MGFITCDLFKVAQPVDGKAGCEPRSQTAGAPFPPPVTSISVPVGRRSCKPISAAVFDEVGSPNDPWRYLISWSYDLQILCWVDCGHGRWFMGSMGLLGLGRPHYIQLWIRAVFDWAVFSLSPSWVHSTPESLLPEKLSKQFTALGQPFSTVPHLGCDSHLPRCQSSL